MKPIGKNSIAETLTTVLSQSITEDSSHSGVVCKRCEKLCADYELHRKQINNIEQKLLKDYNDTMLHLDAAAQESLNTLLKADDEVPEEQSAIVPAPAVSSIIVSDANNVQEFMIQGKKVVLIKQTNLSQRVRKNAVKPTSQPPAILIEQHGEEFETDQPDDGTTTVIMDEDQFVLSQVQANDQEYFDGATEVEISTEGNYDFLDSTSVTDDTGSVSYRDIRSELSLEAVKIKKEVAQCPDPSASENVTSDEVIKIEQAESNVFDDISMKPIFMRDGVKFMCQLCVTSSDLQVVYDSRSITSHLKNDHDERVYICDICGSDFRKRNELSDHHEEHLTCNQEGDFQCEVCNRMFNNARLFRIHKRMHYTTVKSWTCKDCNKKYSSRNLLEEHMNMHTGERPHKCTYCTKDFASKYTLTAHQKIHMERKRPYDCKTCSKSFYSHQNLIQHERTHTGVKEYVCTVCDKAFGTAHNLDVHKIVHTGYKPFICRTCNKAFARRAEIKDHERTHTGERPYSCDLCGSTFAQRSNLMSHKRATHLNDKRYKCEQCDKSFKRRRLLDYHQKATHTGERPYACDQCSSTFVYPEHYKKHLRIHSGVKPYKCEVCDKAFNSRDNRNAHRFVHSEKKPYECLDCGQGFMRKPLLLAHMTAQNHENPRILMNQPNITTGNGIETEYVSNVVLVDEDNMYDMNEDVSLV